MYATYRMLALAVTLSANQLSAGTESQTFNATGNFGSSNSCTVNVIYNKTHNITRQIYDESLTDANGGIEGKEIDSLIVLFNACLQRPGHVSVFGEAGEAVIIGENNAYTLGLYTDFGGYPNYESQGSNPNIGPLSSTNGLFASISITYRANIQIPLILNVLDWSKVPETFEFNQNIVITIN